MQGKEGYIKLFRSLTEWEWYSDANTLRVFIHCLLKANWKDGKFKGTPVPRGTFITSVDSISEDLKLTPSQVRTALLHLEKSGNIARKSTNKWQAITVENYGFFQSPSQTNDEQDSKQVANKSQTNSKQIATIEEIKNVKREEFKNQSLRLMTDEESSSLKARIRQAAEERRRHGA